jgi:glucosamine--fructose-6-phosphate aminotransferase (isomerizing)
MKPGGYTYAEIMSQGRAWKMTLDAVQSFPAELAGWLRKPWGEVVFVGCGSTYYLSLSAAAIWQSISGIPAKGMPSSELWLFPKSMAWRRPALLVAVSRSGETSETLRAADVFAEQEGADYLSIVCYPDSQLAIRSPHLLLTQNAQEDSVAQTRSFTSMLVLAQHAAGVTAGNTNYLAEIKAIPASFERLVSEYEPLARELGASRELSHFVFLGSGANYGLACEAMLKMKEMSLSSSEAFHFLEFRHGPISIITPRTLVVGLLSDSVCHEELKVLSEVKALGATVLAVAETAVGREVDHTVELRSGVSEFARTPLMLPVLQLMAYYRSMSKDLNPDRPKNLEAVVKF